MLEIPRRQLPQPVATGDFFLHALVRVLEDVLHEQCETNRLLRLAVEPRKTVAPDQDSVPSTDDIKPVEGRRTRAKK